jgi:hypothetical protein
MISVLFLFFPLQGIMAWLQKGQWFGSVVRHWMLKEAVELP